MIFHYKQLHNLLDSIGQATLSLRDNRLRTILSILGIAVGIAAVMATIFGSRIASAVRAWAKSG